jgi:rubredoxin
VALFAQHSNGKDSEMKKYKCEYCDSVFDEDEIETVNDNSGASDGTIDICPECYVPESFSAYEGK